MKIRHVKKTVIVRQVYSNISQPLASRNPKVSWSRCSIVVQQQLNYSSINLPGKIANGFSWLGGGSAVFCFSTTAEYKTFCSLILSSLSARFKFLSYGWVNSLGKYSQLHVKDNSWAVSFGLGKSISKYSSYEHTPSKLHAEEMLGTIRILRRVRGLVFWN